jgi:hypothetical protein
MIQKLNCVIISMCMVLFCACSFPWKDAFKVKQNENANQEDEILKFNRKDFFTSRVCMFPSAYTSKENSNGYHIANSEEITIPSYYSFNPFLESDAQVKDSIVEENTLFLEGFHNSDAQVGENGRCVYFTNFPDLGSSRLHKFYSNNDTMFFNSINNLWVGNWRIESISINEKMELRLITQFEKKMGFKKRGTVKWSFVVHEEKNAKNEHFYAIKLESVSTPKIEMGNTFSGDVQIPFDEILEYQNPYSIDSTSKIAKGLIFFEQSAKWKSKHAIDGVKDNSTPESLIIRAGKDAYLVSGSTYYKYENNFTFLKRDELKADEAKRTFSK